MTGRVGYVVPVDRVPLGERTAVSRWLIPPRQRPATAITSTATPVLVTDSRREDRPSTARPLRVEKIHGP